MPRSDRRSSAFIGGFKQAGFTAVALFILSIATASSALAAEFTFAAVGDTPYTADEEERFPALIAEMNREDLAFAVHVGDFKAAWMPCSDELFRQRREWFEFSRHPFIFVPGDNEWTDCGRFAAGRYDPLERLAALRRNFFDGGHSLGQRRIALERQSPAYPEHARWRHGQVLFITLNAPGPNNNARLMPEEHRQRGAAIADWLSAAFGAARGGRAKAVVILMQANPWASPSSRYFGFRGLLAQLARESSRFDGPVVLIHGDTHRHRVDHPLRAPASGKPVANFTRVEVHGYPVMNWLRIRVIDDAGSMRFEVTPGS